MTRILVVEDEAAIRRFVAHALALEGMQVFEVDTVERAAIESGTRKPDLAIVDLGLPDGDRADFIRGLRAWSTLPVLVLSARGSEAQKVAALDAGAVASAHARAFRPYLDERTFRKVTGRGLGETWREFALERSQALQPEMAPARLTTRGVVQTSPRLSPDGALLAYTSAPWITSAKFV